MNSLAKRTTWLSCTAERRNLRPGIYETDAHNCSETITNKPLWRSTQANRKLFVQP